MLPQRLLNDRFPTDGVIIEDNAITSNIEGQILAARARRIVGLLSA